MFSYRTAQILRVVLVVLLAVVAIIVLVTVARYLFSPRINTQQVNPAQTALLNTAADRGVIMKVRGPLVADEDHRSYQIMITPEERATSVYQGYTQQQVDNIVLGNNTRAYEQFVHALNRDGFMNGTELVGDSNDTRGICATGRLYEFQVIQGEKVIRSLWTTSCSNRNGSFRASVSSISQLFFNQVPTARSAISGI